MRVPTSLFAAALLAALAARPAPARANPACGDTIPADTVVTLTGDLDCSAASGLAALYVGGDNVTIDGTAANYRIIAPAFHHAISYNGPMKHNVVVRRLNAGTGNAGGVAINLWGDDLVLDRVTATGMHMGASLDGARMRVTGCNFSNSRAHGLAIRNGAGAVVEGNDLRGNGLVWGHGSLILTEPAGTATVSSNVFDGSWAALQVNAGRNYALDVTGLGNSFAGIAGHAVYVTDNTSHHVTVRGVVATGLGNGGSTGANLQGGYSHAIDRCVFANFETGVAASGSPNPVITRVEAVGRAFGVRIHQSDNPTITDCTLSDSTQAAVHIQQSAGPGTFARNVYTNSYRAYWVLSSRDFVFDEAVSANVLGNHWHYLHGEYTNSGFTVHGVRLQGRGGSSQAVTLGGDNTVVTDCAFTGFGMGVSLAGSNLQVRRNTLTGGVQWGGLWVGAGAGASITDNVLGPNSTGLLLYGYTGALELTGNDFTGAARAIGLSGVVGTVLDNATAGNVFGGHASGVVLQDVAANTNVTVRNLAVTGMGTGYGVSLSGTGNRVQNADLRRFSVGAYVTGGSPQVVDCTLRENVDYGLVVHGATGATVTGNDLRTNTRVAMRLWDYRGEIVLAGNEFSGSETGLQAGGLSGTVLDNTAAGNVFDSLVTCLTCEWCTNVTARGIVTTGRGGTGVYLMGTGNTAENVVASGFGVGVVTSGDNATIRGCAAHANSSYGIQLANGGGGALVDNDATDNRQYSMALSDYTGALTFTGNRLGGSPNGIRIWSVRDTVLDNTTAGNDFGSNANLGIHCDFNCNHMTFRAFDLSATGGTGLAIGPSSGGNTVERVRADNRASGISTQGTNTTVTGCTLRNGRNHGIRVDSGGATVTNNVATGWGDAGLVVANYTGAIELRGNDFSGSRVGLWFHGLCRDIVIANALSGAGRNVLGSITGTGIYVEHACTGLDLANFDVSWPGGTGTNTGTGVWVSGNANTLRNIDASGRTLGIGSAGSALTVLDSRADHCGQGLYVVPTSGTVTGATLKGNSLRWAASQGLYLQSYADALVLAGNDFRDSVRGVNSVGGLNVVVDGAPSGLAPNLFGDNLEAAVVATGAGTVVQNLDATGSYAGTGVAIVGDNATVRNVVAKRRIDGIYVAGRGAGVYDSLARDNSNGVRIAGADAIVQNNRLCWNSATGLTADADAPLDARDNFWGSPSGPRLPDGSGGLGDLVGGWWTRVRHAPWLESGAGCESLLPVRALVLTGLADAPAGTPQTLVVTAVDRNGAVAATYQGTVSIASSDAQAELPAPGALTNGVGSFPLVLRTAGTQTVTVTDLATPNLFARVAVRVSGGTPARIVLVSGDAQTGAVATALAQPLVVRLSDEWGNLSDGRDVAFAATTAGGAVSAAVARTGTDGTASVTATLGTVAGAYEYTASYQGATGSPVAFRATAVPGPATIMFVTDLAAQVTAGVAASFRVHVEDDHGNVVTAYSGPVRFSSSDRLALLPETSSLTDGAGLFSCVLRTAGRQTVAVADARIASFGGGASTEVLAAAPTQLTLVSGNAQVAVAGTSAPAPLVVKTSDAWANPCPGIAVTFAATGGGGSISPTSTDTDAGGLASATATLGTTAGVNSFRATAAGIAGPVHFQLIGSAGEPARLVYVSGGGQSAPVGTALPAPLVAMATDAWGNPARGAAVAFASEDGTVAPPQVTTDSSGLARATATLGSAAGAQVFTASASFADDPVTFTVTGLAGTAARLRLVSGDGQTDTAGDALGEPLVVRVEDAAGNPVAGATVSFSASAGASTSPAIAVTNPAGDAAVRAVLAPVAGANTFAAEAPGLEGSPVVFHATGVAGTGARLVLTGAPARARAGETLVVVATVLDAAGNVATTATGPVALATDDAAATLPAPAPLVSGQATLTLSFATAGERSLSATDEADGSLASSPQTVLVEPAEARTLEIAGGDGQTDTAGGALPLPLRVRARDAFANPASGVEISFAAATPGAAVSPALATTAADGTAATVATLAPVAGANEFTATAAGLTGSPRTFAATGVPGEAARLTLDGAPASVRAGETFQVTVTAWDAGGNVATGAAGAVGLLSSDPAALLPAPGALAQGAAVLAVSLRTAGTRTLQARHETRPSVVSPAVAVQVLPSLSGALALSPAESRTTAGAPTTLALAAVDAFGNPLPGAASVEITVGGGARVRATTLGGAQGTGTARVTGTLSAAGTASLTTIDLAAEMYEVVAHADGLTDGRASVLVGPAAADRIAAAADGDGRTDACGCLEVSLRLVDGYNNAVAEALPQVTVTTSGAARLTATSLAEAAPALPAASVTGALGADGAARLTVCDERAETVEVRATQPQLPGRAGLATLVFAVGALSAERSTVASDTALLQTRSGRARLTVTPRDACGLPLGPGHDVVLHASAGTLDAVSDLGDGTYVATLTIATCPAGEAPVVEVDAAVDGVALSQRPTLAVTCVPVSAEQTGADLAAASLDLCEDRTRSRARLTVTPRDDNGAPLGPGQSVTVAADGLDAVEATDKGDGTYEVAFTALDCGTDAVPLVVQVNGVALAKEGLAVAFTCPPVDPSRSAVALERDHLQAGGVDSVAVTVTARNRCDEPAAGSALELRVGKGLLAQASGTLDATGAFATRLSSLVEGEDEVAATVDGTALASAPVTYDPPPLRRAGGGIPSACGCGAAGPTAAALALLALAGGRRRRRR